MECLTRKATGSVQSQSKTVIKWVITNNAIEVRLPNPLGVHISPQCSLVLDMELYN